MSATPAPLRRLLPHLVLSALLVLELLLAFSQRRSAEELWREAEEGTPRERVAALHVLANRGSDPAAGGVDAELARALLDGEEPLLADFAFTTDICRLIGLEPLEEHLAQRKRGGLPFEAWLRRFLLHRRKVGGPALGAVGRLKHHEVRWFLDALGGRALDERAVLERMEREIRARGRRL